MPVEPPAWQNVSLAEPGFENSPESDDLPESKADFSNEIAPPPPPSAPPIKTTLPPAPAPSPAAGKPQPALFSRAERPSSRRIEWEAPPVPPRETEAIEKEVQASWQPPASLRTSKTRESQPPRHNLLVIGQYDDLYVFCQNSEGLLVIDQHAAHERLIYEKLRRQYLEGKVARQTLMFPETVELSLFQAQLVEKHGEEIERMGFTVRDFGGNTYIVSAIPALAGTASPRELFLDVLEQFGSETENGKRGDRGGFLDHILASLACKAAVKAGTSLSRPEIDRLLAEMAKADLFSHCPHGRPVLKQFSRDDIKKWFYRT
jgi:DNA mismatch repair protein MutL